jgi:hypothetical protein
MKALFSISLLLLFLSGISQEVIVPNLVTTTAGQFNATCPVENLILDYDALTDETTPFPYEVTSQFTSTGIGYISSSSLGTIVFEFDTPLEVVDMLVWQAYFTIEIDHSINSCELTYFDALNNNLGSDLVTVPIANLANDEGFVVPLTTTANVSRIELQVNSLHGGNEISLRRVAFRGSATDEGCTASAACNYDSNATIDDGSCIYPTCDSGCLDENDNGICDIDEIMGCMDSSAVNYHPIFSIDDGSCAYLENLCGPNTVWDEGLGMCVGTGDSCPGDFNADGIVNTADLLEFLGFYGTIC